MEARCQPFLQSARVGRLPNGRFVRRQGTAHRSRILSKETNFPNVSGRKLIWACRKAYPLSSCRNKRGVHINSNNKAGGGIPVCMTSRFPAGYDTPPLPPPSVFTALFRFIPPSVVYRLSLCFAMYRIYLPTFHCSSAPPPPSATHANQ